MSTAYSSDARRQRGEALASVTVLLIMGKFQLVVTYLGSTVSNSR